MGCSMEQCSQTEEKYNQDPTHAKSSQVMNDDECYHSWKGVTPGLSRTFASFDLSSLCLSLVYMTCWQEGGLVFDHMLMIGSKQLAFESYTFGVGSWVTVQRWSCRCAWQSRELQDVSCAYPELQSYCQLCWSDMTCVYICAVIDAWIEVKKVML